MMGTMSFNLVNEKAILLTTMHKTGQLIRILGIVAEESGISLATMKMIQITQATFVKSLIDWAEWAECYSKICMSVIL